MPQFHFTSIIHRLYTNVSEYDEFSFGLFSTFFKYFFKTYTGLYLYLIEHFFINIAETEDMVPSRLFAIQNKNRVLTLKNCLQTDGKEVGSIYLCKVQREALES